MRTIFFTGLLTLLLITNGYSNNLQISNASVTGQDATNDFTMVQFDISWDNSWRDNVNHDAAWVFVKYSTDNGVSWSHATLNTTAGNHNPVTGSAITPASDGVGAFIHRSLNGSGGNSWASMQLRWEYGTDGLPDNASVMVRVFGIEMVYVGEGAYYAGDGATTNIQGQLEAETTGAPFQITSEAALTLGGGGTGSIGNNNALNSNDDFNDATSQSLPSAFPKGYNAYYSMKYEISQEQYKDFLNTLNRDQQNARTATDISSTTITNIYVMISAATSGIRRNGISTVSTTLPASGPVTFYCDYTSTSPADSSADGQTIACNFLNGHDILAYADWSGLRPMTELEFEKACRGPIFPIANQYPWGTTSATPLTGPYPVNSMSWNEAAVSSSMNIHVGTPNYGPVRVGIFAEAGTTREESGAGYWGIMNLGGNLRERVVTLGTASGRAFTGNHGDGELVSSGSSAGDANTVSWTCYGVGQRGYSVDQSTVKAMELAEISNRRWATTTDCVARSQYKGGRCARTAP